ncbi:hypothetical protein CXU09_00980 [Akkermansia muciniphila]|jgi:hypothetical protein|uniref:Uncharacterized protein n=1 Tax=Akkermansia muciniphila TaxID=239935 RepID=A0AAP8TA77_9BACT|nr:hypothetical protein CXU09_00980 [Akkermansia muciniphila]
MNLGPEFSVFGESVLGKMPSPVFEYRFPEKKMCVPGAALPSPEVEEAGADELLTVERVACFRRAHSYHRLRHVLGMGKTLGQDGVDCGSGSR